MVGLPSATFLKNALGETSHWIKVQSSTSQIKGEGIQIRNDYISSVLWYDMAAFVSGSGEKAENAPRDSGMETEKLRVGNLWVHVTYQIAIHLISS